MSLVNSQGTVRHSSLPIKPATVSSDFGKNDIYLARIDEVIYADDERNTSNQCPSQKPNTRLQYNVTILEGPKAGTQIFAVTDGETRGDGSNHKLRVRKATTKKFKGPESDSPAMSDGEYVLVAFIGGSLTAPMIVGSAPHPLNTATTPSKPTDPDTDVTEVKEINGVRTTYYASGKHVIETMGGPKDSDGNRTNASAAGTKTTIKADGSIETTDGTQTITIEKGSKITIAGTATEMTSTGNMKLKSSGIAEVKSTGIMDVDGSLIKVGGGGPSAARIGDMVISEGVDSNGDSHALIGHIIGGSVLSLVGG